MTTDRKSLDNMAVQHIDNKEEGEIFEKDTNRDYAGASAKTDPAEIALVRKLDYRILPTLFVMYFLNYVDSKSLVYTYKMTITDCIRKRYRTSTIR